MTQPPESAGRDTGDSLATAGPTSHARTEEPRTDPQERDLLGAPPRQAAGGEGGAAEPDDLDVTDEDPAARAAVARDPGQQYGADET